MRAGEEEIIHKITKENNNKKKHKYIKCKLPTNIYFHSIIDMLMKSNWFYYSLSHHDVVCLCLFVELNSMWR